MRKGKIKKKKKVVKAELSDSRGFEIFASRGNEGNREEERRGRGCFCRVAQGMPHEEQGDPAASRACHGRAALARVCPKHAWPRLWLGLEPHPRAFRGETEHGSIRIPPLLLAALPGGCAGDTHRLLSLPKGIFPPSGRQKYLGLTETAARGSSRPAALGTEAFVKNKGID